MSLAGRVALITSSSRNIGRSIALELARAGAEHFGLSGDVGATIPLCSREYLPVDVSYEVDY